jgi:hypothetical protein
MYTSHDVSKADGRWERDQENEEEEKNSWKKQISKNIKEVNQHISGSNYKKCERWNDRP